MVLFQKHNFENNADRDYRKCSINTERVFFEIFSFEHKKCCTRNHSKAENDARQNVIFIHSRLCLGNSQNQERFLSNSKVFHCIQFQFILFSFSSSKRLQQEFEIDLSEVDIHIQCYRCPNFGKLLRYFGVLYKIHKNSIISFACRKCTRCIHGKNLISHWSVKVFDCLLTQTKHTYLREIKHRC